MIRFLIGSILLLADPGKVDQATVDEAAARMAANSQARHIAEIEKENVDLKEQIASMQKRLDDLIEQNVELFQSRTTGLGEARAMHGLSEMASWSDRVDVDGNPYRFVTVTTRAGGKMVVTLWGDKDDLSSLSATISGGETDAANKQAIDLLMKLIINIAPTNDLKPVGRAIVEMVDKPGTSRILGAWGSARLVGSTIPLQGGGLISLRYEPNPHIQQKPKAPAGDPTPVATANQAQSKPPENQQKQQQKPPPKKQTPRPSGGYGKKPPGGF